MKTTPGPVARVASHVLVGTLAGPRIAQLTDAPVAQKFAQYCL